MSNKKYQNHFCVRNFSDLPEGIPYYFHHRNSVEEHGVTVHIQHPSLFTFSPDKYGQIDILQKSMLMMLGLGDEMELHYQQSRRIEGIAEAKKKNKYRGRIKGSSYSSLKIIERHSDIVNLLNHSELADTQIAEIVKKGLSTVKRVKKAMKC